MAKKLALAIGIVFTLVGILGFIPNPIVGPDAFFVTDGIHNLVHLITGLILLGIALAAEESSAAALKVFGFIYLLVAILGFFSVSADSTGEVLAFLVVNSADNWLHLVLGIIILGAAFMSGSSKNEMMTPPATSEAKNENNQTPPSQSM